MTEENEYDLPKGKKLNIDINVDSKVMRETLERLNKTEEALEEEKTARENAESKLKILAEKKLSEKRDYFRGLGYSGSLESFEDVRSAREWEQSRDPIGLGGSGNLSLEGNLKASGKLKEGFDSVESMIDYLHETKNKPVLDELWKKNLSAIKSGDLPNTIYDENREEFKGQPSIIMKILQRKNESIRKKMREQKESEK